MEVQQLNEFFKNADYQPAFNAGITALGFAVCVVVLVIMMHTLRMLGQRTPLHAKDRPISTWNRRFYASSGGMVIFLLMLMWLLSAWSHKIARAQ